MQQRRFAGARGRHQRHRLSRPQRELGAVEDGERGRPLRVLALYLVEIDGRYIFRPLLHVGPHSYRSASTGSRRAARHDGYSVARKDSVSAMITTALVSPKSISDGSMERKKSYGENNSVLVSQDRNCRIDSMFRQISMPTKNPVSVPTTPIEAPVIRKMRMIEPCEAPMVRRIAMSW